MNVDNYEGLKKSKEQKCMCKRTEGCKREEREERMGERKEPKGLQFCETYQKTIRKITLREKFNMY